jgi:hypothetical protein
MLEPIMFEPTVSEPIMFEPIMTPIGKYVNVPAEEGDDNDGHSHVASSGGLRAPAALTPAS